MRGINEPQWDPLVLSINQKVGIQCQNSMPVMNFRHPNNAGVCQRHRNVFVLPKKLADLCDLLLNLESDAKRAVLDELQEANLYVRITLKSEQRFHDHWLTSE